jgi:hypothetical protein
VNQLSGNVRQGYQSVAGLVNEIHRKIPFFRPDAESGANPRREIAAQFPSKTGDPQPTPISPPFCSTHRKRVTKVPYRLKINQVESQCRLIFPRPYSLFFRP